MKTLIPLTAIAALAASGLTYAQSSTAAFSTPSGYVTLGNPDGNSATPDVPANTDVTVSIPFQRETEAAGRITGVAGNVLSFANIGFQANSLVSAETPYQITITSGAQEGLIGVISANTASSVTIGSVIVGNIAAIETDGSATFVISKAWTLGSFFPSSFPPGTNVFAFSGAVAGQNLSADLGFVWTGTAWVQIAGSGGNGSNTMIFPGESMIVRTGATPISSFVISGTVPTYTSRALVSKISPTLGQDTRASFTVPVDQPIEALVGAQAGDNLLAFDNSAPGQNKAANVVLVFSGTSWFGVAGVTGNQTGIFNLKAGQGYVLRRPATAPVGDITVSLTPTYAEDL